MRYVVAFRKFLLVAFLWWVGYRAANALDFWVQTDRGYKGRKSKWQWHGLAVARNGL